MSDWEMFTPAYSSTVGERASPNKPLKADAKRTRGSAARR